MWGNNLDCARSKFQNFWECQHSHKSLRLSSRGCLGLIIIGSCHWSVADTLGSVTFRLRIRHAGRRAVLVIPVRENLAPYVPGMRSSWTTKLDMRVKLGCALREPRKMLFSLKNITRWLKNQPRGEKSRKFLGKYNVNSTHFKLAWIPSTIFFLNKSMCSEFNYRFLKNYQNLYFVPFDCYSFHQYFMCSPIERWSQRKIQVSYCCV